MLERITAIASSPSTEILFIDKDVKRFNSISKEIGTQREVLFRGEKNLILEYKKPFKVGLQIITGRLFSH